VYSGELDANKDDMKKFLITTGVAADEAELMAESFANNTAELMEFGAALNASDTALNSYYAAMA
jgi:hypothetical protein